MQLDARASEGASGWGRPFPDYWCRNEESMLVCEIKCGGKTCLCTGLKYHSSCFTD